MFGVLSPCRHRLGDELTAQWRAHMCGLCLALRDGHGHLARLTTNTDAVMISILTEAQRGIEASTTRAGRCPLRGMRPATVVAAADPGIRLAATASLTLAAAKAGDVGAEQQLGLAPPSRIATLAARAASPLLRRSAAADGGPDVDTILATLDRQAEIECTTTCLDELTGPTAQACAEVFAATADAADVPANRADLATMGSDFGRIAHLLDAVDDYHSDALAGAFNPLRASGTDVDSALSDCRRLVTAIGTRYTRLHLGDDRLLRAVLLDGLRHAIAQRTHARTQWPPYRPPEYPQSWPYPPPFPPNRGFADRIGPFLASACMGKACCADHWNHCSDKFKEPCCDGSDCCDCDCGDCCDCCGCDC
ncbi:DUF5685 family protein [Gordonia sp. DT219]|uniref:DUF5685 family protein n=1 Tax=Gordonia sp. DT219 TaxID=3416658 RepID=UPI003CEA667C